MGNQRFDDISKSAAEGSLGRRLKKGLFGAFAGALLAGSAVGGASADVFVDTSGDGVTVDTGEVLVDTSGDGVIVDTGGDGDDDGVTVVTDNVVVRTGDGDVIVS